MTAEQANQTPIGIMPEWLWRYDRLKELSKVIQERVSHDTGGLYISSPIPDEWFIEYGEHILWLSKNKPEQLIEFIYR